MERIAMAEDVGDGGAGDEGNIVGPGDCQEKKDRKDAIVKKQSAILGKVVKYLGPAASRMKSLIVEGKYLLGDFFDLKEEMFGLMHLEDKMGLTLIDMTSSVKAKHDTTVHLLAFVQSREDGDTLMNNKDYAKKLLKDQIQDKGACTEVEMLRSLMSLMSTHSERMRRNARDVFKLVEHLQARLKKMNDLCEMFASGVEGEGVDIGWNQVEVKKQKRIRASHDFRRGDMGNGDMEDSDEER
jgi:hypothetical protein